MQHPPPDRPALEIRFEDPPQRPDEPVNLVHRGRGPLVLPAVGPSRATPAFALTNPPPALLEVARAAVGDAPPSYRTALRLEAFFRQEYKLAAGASLPTGHGYGDALAWPEVAVAGGGWVALDRRAGWPRGLLSGCEDGT